MGLGGDLFGFAEGDGGGDDGLATGELRAVGGVDAEGAGPGFEVGAGAAEAMAQGGEGDPVFIEERVGGGQGGGGCAARRENEASGLAAARVRSGDGLLFQHWAMIPWGLGTG